MLTDGQIEGIASAATSQSILDLSPQWMVDAKDSLVEDLTAGTANRTSVVGTTAGGSDPSGWVYYSPPTPSVIPSFANFPKQKMRSN